ncbi:MAG: hypothetical protein AABY68_05980 [Pseudomonadota bacterium]
MKDHLFFFHDHNAITLTIKRGNLAAGPALALKAVPDLGLFVSEDAGSHGNRD